MEAKRYFSSYEMLRMVEGDHSLGIWCWEAKPNILYWSPGLYAILGIPSRESPSFDLFSAALDPDDRALFRDPSNLLSEGVPNSSVLRLVNESGGTRIFQHRIEISRSAEGVPFRLTGVLKDVTELELLRNAYEGAKKRIEAASELLSVDFWTAYPDGSATDQEPWRRKTGQTASEIAGWGRLKAIHPDDQSAFKDAWREALKTGKYSAQYRMRVLDGSYQSIRSKAIAIRNKNGDIEWWYGVCGPDERIVYNGSDTIFEDIDPAQIRAARGCLGWTLFDLAEESEVSISTIRRMESETISTSSAATRRAILTAFARHNVRFGRNSREELLIVFSSKAL